MSVPAINGAHRPFDKLPPKKRQFIDEYVRLGDAWAAYQAVGYKGERNQAATLLRKMAPYLRERTDHLLHSVDMAILGNKVVMELAENSDNDTVRLNAAKALMERAAPEKPQEQVIHHKHEQLENMETKAIDERIANLKEKLGLTNVEA